ncbi:hypothetical protein JRQ81_002531 [Phrynocephalus forsythii]|uniref:HTH CENPB-type domain-containing protein n=1 Tax=Phrynocephalus forsythii TaxID=171643 RepID=A0A9Q0XI11_9SAUR|nr:hypothetical protein JRQ81_002531 [Phrynocephalus forsythii]
MEKSGTKSKSKSKRRIISLELKKEIISRYENGARLMDLSKQYDMPRTTIATIIKNNKDMIKEADVAKGVSILTKSRPQSVEEMETLLLIWINEKQVAGDSISESLICEKALRLHADIIARPPGASDGAEVESFKASHGWFDNFKKRTSIHSVVRYGEAASTNTIDADQFVLEFKDYVTAQDFVPQQVFNCDETGLFWKKMPKRTYITREEKALPGYKPMKDRLTLLFCANASGDLKLKPLLVYHSENPRVFKKNNVVKSQLKVMWRSNSRAWVTRSIFMEWVHEVFGPSVTKYLQDKNLPMRCLLLLDNAPGHPPGLERDLAEEFAFINVKFLPPNTTSLIQPMDQLVISNFKKLYTKALFQRCFDVTSETELTLRDFWKNHFNIFHSLQMIVKAWKDVTEITLKAAWKKLWPDAVTEAVLEDAPIVEEIVNLGDSLGLDVSNADVEELLEGHRTELMTEELQSIMTEQERAAAEENVSEEEEEQEQDESRPSISTALIKETLAKWDAVQTVFETYHPDRDAIKYVTNTVNNIAVPHFRKLLRHRLKQVSIDSFFVRKRTSDSEPSDSGIKSAREGMAGDSARGPRLRTQTMTTISAGLIESSFISKNMAITPKIVTPYGHPDYQSVKKPSEEGKGDIITQQRCP